MEPISSTWYVRHNFYGVDSRREMFCLGLPHVVTQDDSYRGYFIKKGTVIWVNIWFVS